MALPLGIFDPLLVPAAWFDPLVAPTVPVPWFDEDLANVTPTSPSSGGNTPQHLHFGLDLEW